MVIRAYKLVVRTLLVVCLIALLSIGSLYLWIITGPRPINYLNRYIEASLDRYLTNYRFHISDSLLLWNEEQKTIDLRIVGVKIHNRKDQPVAAFPQLAVGVNIADIFRGHLEPTDLMIVNPAFKLTMQGQSSPQESQINIYDAYKVFIRELFSMAKSKFTKTGTNNIRISNADFLFTHDGHDILLRITHGYITFLNNAGKLIITAELSTILENKEVAFSFLLEQQSQDKFLAHIGVTRFPSEILRSLFPQSTAIQQVDVVADGKVTFIIPEDSSVFPEMDTFELSHLSGVFSHPEYFKYPITIKDMNMQGHFIGGASGIAIDALALKTDTSELALKGFIKQENFQLKEISLEAAAKNVPVDEIFRYWPEGLGELPRHWVVSNIARGIVPEASAKLFLTEEDISNKKIPEEALEAKVDFTNASVNYFPIFPPAEQVNGTAFFSGKTMHIVINQGKILDSNVTEGDITIPDMQEHLRPVINIKGKAVGPVANGMTFFDNAPVDKYLQTALASVSGEAVSTVDLAIPLIHPLTFRDLTIDIRSKLNNAALKGVFKKYDVSKADFDFKYNGAGVVISGDSLVNGVPVELTIDQPIYQEQFPYLGKYQFSTILSPEKAEKLSLPTFSMIKGDTGVRAQIIQQAKVMQVNLDLDFVQAELKYPSLGWIKPTGEALNVSALVEDKGDGNLSIPSFSLSSPTVHGKGKANISGDFSHVNALTLNNLRFGKNDFSLMFSRANTLDTLAVTGKSLDIGNASYGELLSPHPSKTPSPPFITKLRLNRLYLKNDEVLSNVKAEMKCQQGFCSTGDVHAEFERKGILEMTLKPVNRDKSHYLAVSNNAGALAKAMNFYKNMEGGSMNLDGHIEKVTDNDNKPDISVRGILKVSNFTATKTPILAKIASLASFQGLTDLLSNKGIQFKRLRAPFTFAKGILEIDDLRASGSALGITSEGYINTLDGTINLAGTFVPSYTLNNILGKIPLVGAIGDVLMGGEGQGIIAARYKIKGTYENAEVTVNPLSILTPGFLRKLFDIMDSGPPKPELKPLSQKQLVAGKPL